MNPLFSLVTITPEFDFNQLEDDEFYDFHCFHAGGIKADRQIGKFIKTATIYKAGQ